MRSAYTQLKIIYELRNYSTDSHPAINLPYQTVKYSTRKTSLTTRRDYANF